MRIVILESSPNRHGSSNLLAERFAQGAQEAGHQVAFVDVAHADIHPCTGCVHCGYEGPCVQKDDVEGIRRQLESHGIRDGLEVLSAERSAEADALTNVPYEYNVGRALTAELIRRRSNATALIGVNDMTALGILAELTARGIRVPSDVSVCGFDNIFSSAITTPSLTTIDHHLRTRCQAAVDMILSRTAPAAAPGPFVNKIEYTPQLIVRSSTGKAREGALESRE